MKRIEETFGFSFGRNGDHEKIMHIEANNYREPQIILSGNERLTVKNIRDMAGFLIQTADTIEADLDFKTE